MKDKPIVLIMCGGRSRRLWPVSEDQSKNFFDIFGFSPLEHTVKRYKKITSPDKIFCITGKKDKRDIEKAKGLKKNNILIEPESKNTAAAILLALLKLQKYKNKKVIIAPVDHLIDKQNQFYGSLKRALTIVEDGGICTLGVVSKNLNSDFGYIQVGKKERNAYNICQFIEKPGLIRAKKLIKQKNCFYNSGIFVAKIDFLLKEYKKYYSSYKLFCDNHNNKRRLQSLYKKIKSMPFDKVIMEKTKKAKLVKANFGWQDFGNWETIYKLLAKDKEKNVKKGKIITDSCKGNFLFSTEQNKKILGVGLKDIFFINTHKHTLIISKKELKNIKKILDKSNLG